MIEIYEVMLKNKGDRLSRLMQWIMTSHVRY